MSEEAILWEGKIQLKLIVESDGTERLTLDDREFDVEAFLDVVEKYCKTDWTRIDKGLVISLIGLLDMLRTDLKLAYLGRE